MNPIPAVHPLLVSRLHDFAQGYFQAIRKLNLDTSPDTRRHLPELFLTVGQIGATPMTLHIFPDPALDAWEGLKPEVQSLIRTYLGGGVQGILHTTEERGAMYDTLQRTGDSRYLHPGALRTLADLRVGRDAYGLTYSTVQTVHVLGLALLALLLWVFPDGTSTLESVGIWLFYAVLGGASYLLLTLPLRVPAVYTLLARSRLQAFGAVLADCQAVGRQNVDDHLAAEIPASVMTRLAQLPAQRPQAQDVLLRDEWRLGELWDLAHRAAHDLAKLPESSLAFPPATLQTEALLDRVLEAFALQAAEPSELHQLHQQITQHAQALGVSTHTDRPHSLVLPQSPIEGVTP
ncbi:hypothetical protein [Deinococcus radiotolerans]|uniref:Uncharacterized protein n=1 Tax=Deinococcus radiotolerans TaxID=1309407 RepID=A0ABQ2FFW4_9DEIO|nr:hypothetical protein [Deinococcus radiotolerans]GGK86620.1 hypothetical protein GCM10010844_01380 [Deinococcus radiotolerans]